MSLVSLSRLSSAPSQPRSSRTPRLPATGSATWSVRVCTGAACATAALLVLAVSGCGAAATRATPYGIVRTPPLRVGSLSLPEVSADGASHEMVFRASPRGLMLVYFGYTYCPDVCPTTLSNLGSALRRLSQSQRTKVSVAMVTVDPRRDTPSVLNAYLQHFLPTWRAVRTTNMARLQHVEYGFDARSHLSRPNASGFYEVTHTAEVYAVDEHGTVDTEWVFGTPQAEITADLRLLLDRASTHTT